MRFRVFLSAASLDAFFGFLPAFFIRAVGLCCGGTLFRYAGTLSPTPCKGFYPLTPYFIAPILVTIRSHFGYRSEFYLTIGFYACYNIIDKTVFADPTDERVKLWIR